jgi:hypothetical protein
MPAETLAERARHGKANLWVSINGLFYVARKIRRHHFTLTRHEKGKTLTYHVQRLAGADWSCTCPDHLNRQTRCKHLGALMALGLLPKVRARKAVANA